MLASEKVILNRVKTTLTIELYPPNLGSTEYLVYSKESLVSGLQKIHNDNTLHKPLNI